MAGLALTSYVAYLGLAFGVRTWLQVRRTGSSGFHGIGGRPGSAEWLAGAAFAVALVLGVVAPVLVLAGAVEPIAALDGVVGHATGATLVLLAIAATLAAQVSMGESWRIGVDVSECTRMVTTGAFAVVRNPVFSAMVPLGIGLVLLAPSWVALAAFFVLVLALELQVRVVEEPYLRAAQGEAYTRYAARVGRFLPGIGRLGGSGA